MSQTAMLSGGCSSAATAPSHASMPSSSELRIRTGTPVPRASASTNSSLLRALPAGRGDEDLDPLAAEPPRPARLRARYLDGLRDTSRADVAVALDLLAETELLPLLVHGQRPAGRPGRQRAGGACSRPRRRSRLARAPLFPARRLANQRPRETMLARLRSGAGAPHQRAVQALARAPLLPANALPVPVGAQGPRPARVLHDRVERARQLALAAGVLDRHEDLDPVVEVARHQVGAAQQERALAVGLEDEEAAVLEEAAEQRAHA